MEFGLRPLGFMVFFCKTTIIRQLKNEMNRKLKKYSKKNRWDFVGIFTYDCVLVCECGLVGVLGSYSCVLLCVRVAGI